MRETIEKLQNNDGGWPYRNGGPSWTEPTAFALIALIARGEGNSAAVDRGVRWLHTMQSPDGGWRPQACVQQSTWVGALVAILPDEFVPRQRRMANIEWLLAQTGQESTPLNRVRQWMIGNSTDKIGNGWPWFPGAAAWITPTALTILALRKHNALVGSRGASGSSIERRIAEGQEFLTLHACDSGGWNHGGARALGYQANGYPETTGLALLALSGTESPVKDAGIRAAQRFLPACRAAEGFAWLSLGLKANGQNPDRLDLAFTPRTVVDTALLSLVDSKQAGIDIWLPKI